MRKFTFLIKESDDPSKYVEVTDKIMDMIKSTIDRSGGEVDQFIQSYIKNPEDVKIEGLINDSDVYDFYLKYRNQIDEVLGSVKFFQSPPDESNVFGLYDFTIVGTMRAIEEFVKMLDVNSDNV